MQNFFVIPERHRGPRAWCCSLGLLLECSHRAESVFGLNPGFPVPPGNDEGGFALNNNLLSNPKIYFNKLNYTLSNEDTSLELGLLSEGCSHALAIAGSGARVLPLFSKHPKILTCVDASPVQLALTQLRIESLRILSHPDFLSFWGYPGKMMFPDERKAIFFRCGLSEEFRTLLLPVFEGAAWEPLLYTGSWEQTIIGFSRIIARVMGRPLSRFFKCQSPEEAQNFLKTSFPALRWKLIVFILANANTFNALLYKGKFPQRNISDSYYRHYTKGFERLFRMSPARENYLLQLVMLGRLVFPEGLPLEADPGLFESMKAGINGAEIHYQQGNLLETFPSLATTPVDFISFSDVPSYFEGAHEQSFLQILKPGLTENATIAIRNFFHIPENLDSTGFHNATAAHEELISSDKTPFYKVEIWERKS